VSDQKKMSDILREEMAVQQKKIEELEAKIVQLSTTSTTEKPSETKKLAIEHIDECPTCREQFKEKLRPEIFNEFKQKLKNKDLVKCDGCGEIVGKDDAECPSCHGKRASPF
jgi:rubrerythrin